MPNDVKPSVPAWLVAYRKRKALREVAQGIICVLVGLVLGLVLSGCAHVVGTVVPRVGQEQAVWIVWREAYGRTDRPPKVIWMEGSDLDCTDPQSGKLGFTIVDIDTTTGEAPVRCREGFTWGPTEVLIAWHGTELTFAETPLAHEFLHALLLRQGVLFEVHHTRPDFYPRIDAANQLLIQAGR